MAARGGSRPGAGRKPKITGPVAQGREIARDVFEAINKTERTEVKRWLELLDSQPYEALAYLTNRKYGKAINRSEDKILFDSNAPLVVKIEHIGAYNSAPAKAK